MTSNLSQIFLEPNIIRVQSDPIERSSERTVGSNCVSQPTCSPQSSTIRLTTASVRALSLAASPFLPCSLSHFAYAFWHLMVVELCPHLPYRTHPHRVSSLYLHPDSEPFPQSQQSFGGTPTTTQPAPSPISSVSGSNKLVLPGWEMMSQWRAISRNFVTQQVLWSLLVGLG